AICYCKDRGARFFDKEFAFVKQISEELWSKKPDAMIVVYPHYFSGTEVPGFGVKAAKQQFDPRWTLFFTPHSAHLEPSRHSLKKTPIRTAIPNQQLTGRKSAAR